MDFVVVVASSLFTCLVVRSDWIFQKHKQGRRRSDSKVDRKRMSIAVSGRIEGRPCCFYKSKIDFVFFVVVAVFLLLLFFEFD